MFFQSNFPAGNSLTIQDILTLSIANKVKFFFDFLKIALQIEIAFQDKNNIFLHLSSFTDANNKLLPSVRFNLGEIESTPG